MALSSKGGSSLALHTGRTDNEDGVHPAEDSSELLAWCTLPPLPPPLPPPQPPRLLSPTHTPPGYFVIPSSSRSLRIYWRPDLNRRRQSQGHPGRSDSNSGPGTRRGR
eukprot:749726-Hanusia_phi.AAC.3